MTEENALWRDRIRALNDAFRRSFVGGTVIVTAGFDSLSADRRHSVLTKVRAFDQFDEDNDPHGEHDFGLIEEGDVRCLVMGRLRGAVDHQVKAIFAEQRHDPIAVSNIERHGSEPPRGALEPLEIP